MPHSSFFPTPETTFTSDDVFTVAHPTSGIATTITSSTRRQPLMHSTPFSSHVSSSNFPSPSGLPNAPIPTRDLEQSASPPYHSERIPIYTPGHESSPSSFSGFSETLVNRARAIASPPRNNPHSNPPPLFDLCNTPFYPSQPNSKPVYLRPPSSRIPRPTTPTPPTSPLRHQTLLILLLSHEEPRHTAHLLHLCYVSPILMLSFEITLYPLLLFETLLLLPLHPLLRSPPQLPLTVVTLVYDPNRAVHLFLVPNHGNNTTFTVIFHTIFSMILDKFSIFFLPNLS